MAVTIDDIAREAGVSVSTVSRVMNNSKPVSEKLRARVFETIERNNFKPNALAQGLATNRTNMIGVVIPDISNAVFGMLTKGINSVCTKRGYTLIVCESGGVQEEEEKLLNVLQDKKISGVLFAGVDINRSLVDHMLEKEYPIVLVTQETPVGDGLIHTVIQDNVKAAYDAARFLLDSGHRRIAYIGGARNDYSSGKKRLQGYQKALWEAGIEVENSLIVQGNFSFQAGFDGMKKLYEESDLLPTAIVTGSDVIASGAIQFLKGAGVLVPEDISIMGFDDLEDITCFKMELSTIRIPYFEEGAKAAKELIQLIDGTTEKPKTTYIPHKIIRRSTVKTIE